MKKIITSTLIVLISINNIKSQSIATPKPKEASKGIASKGNNIVNVYYGVNLLTSVLKNAVTNANATDVTVKSSGPFGGVFEHLVVDKIGLGAEIGYGSTTVSFNDVYSSYNYVNNSYYTNTYYYSYKFSTLRVMFRANFHFINNEKFDAYGFMSAGYRGTTLSFSSNDPYAIEANVTTIPFGIKPGVGLRYFFVDAVGINLEMAIGAPIISGGLSFKF